MSAETDKGDDLPPNWIKRYSKVHDRGRPYYFNVKTKQSSWTHPKKTDSRVDLMNSSPKRPRRSTHDEHSLNKSSLTISRKKVEHFPTPAQNRLKTLQENLLLQQFEKKIKEIRPKLGEKQSQKCPQSTVSKTVRERKVSSSIPLNLSTKAYNRKSEDLNDCVPTSTIPSEKPSSTQSSVPKSFLISVNERFADASSSSVKPTFASIGSSSPTQLDNKTSNYKQPIAKSQSIFETFKSDTLSRNQDNVQRSSPYKSKKFSANDRLTRIRDQCNLPSKQVSTIPTSESIVSPHPQIEDVPMNDASDSVFSKPEAMEWDDEEILQEIYLIRSSESSVNEKRESNHSEFCSQTGSSLCCIVIDTNIFLSQMVFVTNLLNKIDATAEKPKVVIPYIVLQELDKLKMKTESAISLLASRAIKFIHEQLKLRKEIIMGQSVIEHNKKLIEIDSPDDYILNCCLQLKLTFGYVILLTNDVNLRNKSMCSNIDTFSKSELQSKIFGDS